MVTVFEKLAVSKRKAEELDKIIASQEKLKTAILRHRFGVEEVLPEVLDLQKQMVSLIDDFYGPHINTRRTALEAMFV